MVGSLSLKGGVPLACIAAPASRVSVIASHSHGPVAELADAADLKSAEQQCSCGFESRRGH